MKQYAKSRFELLKLATYVYYLPNKILSRVQREGHAHHLSDFFGCIPEAFNDSFCLACVAAEATVVYAGGQIEGTVVIDYSHCICVAV